MPSPFWDRFKPTAKAPEGEPVESVVAPFEHPIVVVEGVEASILQFHEDMIYRLGESKLHPGAFRVERKLDDGRYESAVFIGANAEERATEYCTSQNIRGTSK